MSKRDLFVSEYINIFTEGIRSWRASRRRAAATCQTSIEWSKIGAVYWRHISTRRSPKGNDSGLINVDINKQKRVVVAFPNTQGMKF